ncbi:MAG: three-Cys-motif partner protein TcmP [Chloroflexaceae bacterium]|nr:three-Cys-motif partner protein TcmP [Chloroflexaceae bacterium]
MTISHQFGGQWTEDKLNRLRKYLNAYLTIFKKNKKAIWYRTIYVDAFAGTGNRNFPDLAEATSTPLFPDETDVKAFQEGSARVALEIEPSFDQYLFIEQNPVYARQLEHLRDQFPYKKHSVTVLQGDANQLLVDWCMRTDWQKHRAIVFLDPYGMQVEWNTIDAVARTQAVDLWILFPLGQAVNRLLTRKAPPEGAWADRLTRFLGTPDWKDAFYQPSPQMSLFDAEERKDKTATFESIGTFFLDRLRSVFAGVAKNPLSLYNSTNVPIYLLCFASANPTKAPLAVRIAQDILK